ncbi:MAG: hypothetical protein VKL39_01885, partial [Leptolyngbyaceae bacterium]|nr:hypothetical protein [Leptolyngbyaceae bacterium]
MPKRVRFEGKDYDFPDDASDEEILGILSQEKPAEPSAPAAPPQSEKPGFLGRFWESTGGAIGDLAQKLYRQGGFKTAEEMGTAIAERFQKNPRKIGTRDPMFGGIGSLPTRAVDAVLGPVVDVVEQDVREGNLAGAAGTIAGNALMLGAPSMLGAAKGPAKAAGTAGKQSVAQGLRESAIEQYGRVLNPTKEGTKFLAEQKIIPELIDRGVTAMSVKGIKKRAANEAARVGQSIGEFWDTLPDNLEMPVSDVIKRVRDEALDINTIEANGKRIPIGPEGARALETTESLISVLDEASRQGPNGVKLMNVKKLREVRQFFDDVAARAKRYQGKDLADANKAEIHGKVADVIRSEFAKANPDLAAANAEYSFWKNVEKVAEETTRRRVGQAKPLGRKIAEAAGTAVGGAKGGV